MHGHKLGLRLFIEGIEVPVIGASINIARNVPVTCSLQLIATDKILEILPRTVVHLFFYDYVAANAPDPPPTFTKEDDDLEATVEDDFNANYKLLFMGEVQGLAFQKDTGSRAVVLNCVDFSNYWDTTYQYNFKGSLLGGRSHAAFIGANANFFTSPLGHGVGTIAALLNGRSVNFPKLKGLLAGIVRVLEAIGGAYYGDTTFRGANDFTAIAELRLKILQQITAAEKDDSSAKLFARKTFNMWMNRQMGSLGKLVTFRGLTQVLQKFIFHDIYPNPAAKYVPKVTGLKKNKTYKIDISKDPRARKFISQVKQLRKQLKVANSSVSLYPSASTTGATVFTPTTVRKDNEPKVLKNAANSLIQARRIVNGFISGGTPNIPGLRKEVATIDRDLRVVDKQIGPGGGIIFSFAIDASKIKEGRRRQAALNALNEAETACDVLLGIKIKKSRTITYDKLDRLNNQILRPDIWFVPPPRCNVLFPEMYGSFNWSRNFLREVSRMELQTTNEILGDDALFNGRYYAPNVVDMRRGLRLSSRRFGKLIMSHELLTGIIPMFEKITEANLFAMKARKVKYKGAKVGLAQRAVNFNYFKHRFASRQMQCQGRFNPWFVCGFPGLILDRPMTRDNLLISGLPIAEQLSALDIIPKTGTNITRAAMLQLLVPTQYFGCCVQLSHTLSQQGGNTSYAFMQARLHRETTEFLGVDKATVNKVVGTARRKTVIAAQEYRKPKKGKRGPRGGTITRVRDVTQSLGGEGKPLYTLQESGRLYTNGRVWAGPTYSHNAYEVTETFTRRARTKIDLPIEEVIRPPWIWDGWQNLKIGKTYMQFFGTNAITDIDGFTSLELLSTYEGADTTLALAETKEGVTFGEKKKQESTDEFLKRISEPDDPTAPRENKKTNEDVNYGTSAQKKVSAAAILTIEKERTIENAVDYLVRVYSFIKHYGLDVGAFMRTYTWRPVATLPEILGSTDFSLTETSPGKYTASGIEGFHSRAFGDVEDLFGLVDPKVKKVLGLTSEKKHTTAKKLDVRARRRQAIWEYMDELGNSRGLLG